MVDIRQKRQQRPEDMSPNASRLQPHDHSRPSNILPSSSHPPAPPCSRTSKSRRYAVPFTFPTYAQPNASSTSLIPSTAEGRPIPLDDSSAADRTSALRELNRSQPSTRRRYTKSSGAPSTATRTTTGTYSQPVIVRTYSGPPPSSTSRPASHRVPWSVSVSSNASNWRPARNGMILSMGRQRGNKKSLASDDVKLPPLEAFSFKNIMADIQQDIGADLDRIAEICARSRYSLSNQYEVHVAPHGSGSGLLGSVSGSSRHHHQIPGGPTLQAVSSDDEQSTTRHRKRRSGARRKSAAYGTLETIMSSSRSSEEDKSKKKSAKEIVDEVRGRTAQNRTDGSESSRSGREQASGERSKDEKKVVRRKSTSFVTAVIDSTRSQGHGEASSPRTSGTALVSEPAKPKTSRNHLEIRTSQEDPVAAETAPAKPSQAIVSESVAAAAIAGPDQSKGQSGILSGISNWMPWRGAAVTEVASSDPKGAKSKSYAEGSLRELLKTTEIPVTDVKGKGVDRAP